MEHLSDQLLLDSYHMAIELDLSPDFLSLIEDEINRRCITTQSDQPDQTNQSNYRHG